MEKFRQGFAEWLVFAMNSLILTKNNLRMIGVKRDKLWNESHASLCSEEKYNVDEEGQWRVWCSKVYVSPEATTFGNRNRQLLVQQLDGFLQAPAEQRQRVAVIYCYIPVALGKPT